MLERDILRWRHESYDDHVEVPGLIRRERAVLYVRRQLDRLARELSTKGTKTLGEHFEFTIRSFYRDVSSLCRMSGDRYLLDLVLNSLRGLGSRTPRKEGITRLHQLDERLTLYSPPSDGDPTSASDDETGGEGGAGRPAAKAQDLTDDKTVFVIMPFKDTFEDVWQGAISRAASEEGYKSIRVDMINKSTNITDDIVDGLKKCKLAIVDVTGNNPNVMFELGYAMALGKKHIVISQSAEFLPFDIKQIRTIVYEDSWSGVEQLKDRLKEFLKTARDDAHPSDQGNSKHSSSPGRRPTGR